MTTARIHATEPNEHGFYPYLIIRYSNVASYALTFESLDVDELKGVEIQLDANSVMNILEGREFFANQPPIEFRCTGDAEKLSVTIKAATIEEEIALSFWMSELALAWNMLSSA